MSLYWSLSLGVAQATVKNDYIRNEKELRRVRRMIRGTQHSYTSILQLGKGYTKRNKTDVWKAINIIETIKREQILAIFHIIRTSILPKATGLKQARASTFSQRYTKIMELFPIGCFADQSTAVFQKLRQIQGRKVHQTFSLWFISGSESFWTADRWKLSKFTGTDNTVYWFLNSFSMYPLLENIRGSTVCWMDLWCCLV